MDRALVAVTVCMVKACVIACDSSRGSCEARLAVRSVALQALVCRHGCREVGIPGLTVINLAFKLPVLIGCPTSCGEIVLVTCQAALQETAYEARALSRGNGRLKSMGYRIGYREGNSHDGLLGFMTFKLQNKHALPSSDEWQ